MIKNNTKFDTNAYKEMTLKSFIAYVFFLVLGIGLIIAFIFVYIATNYNLFVIFLLILGLVSMMGGGAYTFLSIRTYLRVKKADLTIKYVFKDDCIEEESSRHGEKVEESKIDYDAFFKYKITKNYLFLYLYNKRSVPIQKDENFSEILKIVKVEDLQKKFF